MGKLINMRIVLNLYWAAIFKDVQDKAYRSAKLAKLGVQDEALGSNLEAEISLTDEDKSMLKRAMTGALAEIQTLITERHFIWTKSNYGNNKNLDEDNIKIVLNVPTNFDKAAIQPMAELIHDYIVAKAMFVWFDYTVPTRSDKQLQVAQLIKKDIAALLSRRVRKLGKGTEVIIEIGKVELSLSATDIDANVNDEVILTATVTPEEVEDEVEFTSNNTDVCEVIPANGAKCKLKMKADGAAVVTAKVRSVTAKVNVNVTSPAPTPSTDDDTTTDTPSTDIDAPNSGDAPSSSTDAPSSVNP